MIRVNGDDNKGLLEYNNYFSKKSKTPSHCDSHRDFLKIQELAQKKKLNDHNQSKEPAFMKELQVLKHRFVNVLDGYKQRERMLMQKCRYLEKELQKERELNHRNRQY